jgi:CYTH domain-containing protein
MDIDAALAARLGFPKAKYAWIERERRWLCRDIPVHRAVSAEAITDLYIDGVRLRLREARPLDGGEPMRRLTRKADADASTRLLTSIYLDEAEYELLSGLPGRLLRKTRYRLPAEAGVMLCVDHFEGPLEGLIMAEAEFEDDASLVAYPDPDFAVRDVTADPRYRGGELCAHGIPAEL